MIRTFGTQKGPVKHCAKVRDQINPLVHIGAEIDEDLPAHAEDRAVAAAGDLDLAIRLSRMVHRRQVLAPVLEPATGRTTYRAANKIRKSSG